MYVCMYRGRPSWRCPWDRAFQLGQGEGPIGIVGPISQPRNIIDTMSHTLQLTNTLLCVFRGNFYSRQLRRSASSYLEEHYCTRPGKREKLSQDQYIFIVSASSITSIYENLNKVFGFHSVVLIIGMFCNMSLL